MKYSQTVSHAIQKKPWFLAACYVVNYVIKAEWKEYQTFTEYWIC